MVHNDCAKSIFLLVPSDAEGQMYQKVFVNPELLNQVSKYFLA